MSDGGGAQGGGGGGRVGGTASSRTTTVPNGKLRGGRRKRRRPYGRHERARSLAKRIRRGKGVNVKNAKIVHTSASKLNLTKVRLIFVQ